MVSGTIERWGTMLAGQPVDAFCASVSHGDLLAIGLNCATGPDLMTDHIRTLAQMASTRISCYPNAGMPDEEGKYPETPESLARQLEKFVAMGGSISWEVAVGRRRPISTPSRKWLGAGLRMP